MITRVNTSPVKQQLQFGQHPEFRVLGLRQAWRDIIDEMVEFVQEPSCDEASDIAFGIGRLLGGLLGRKYASFPGDGRHIAKCNARYASYGHFRSQRHLTL